jgi:hypothetical protein
LGGVRGGRALGFAARCATRWAKKGRGLGQGSAKPAPKTTRLQALCHVSGGVCGELLVDVDGPRGHQDVEGQALV